MSAERQTEDLPQELFDLFERIAEQVYERKEAEKNAQAPVQNRDEELTVRQVAKLKGVERRTIYDWVARKRIPFHYTPGGQLRFYRRHVEAVVSPN